MIEFIDLNLYNKRTLYTNCTVEVWENTYTGKTSVGWYRTEDTEELSEEDNECLS